MKKTVIFTVILLMVLAMPVFAQSASYFHEVTVELDGEWDLNTSFNVGKTETNPAFSSGVTLKGVGQARIHAITKASYVPVWWDLF